MNRSTFRTLIVLVSLIATALPFTISATAADTSVTVDFEGLSGFVSSVSVGNGVSGGAVDGAIAVSGRNVQFPGQNAALIFSSTCGGAPDASGCVHDADLYKPKLNGTPTDLGNVLIVSENMVVSPPDDADLKDSELHFDFSNFGPGQVDVESLTLIDIEHQIELASVVVTFADGRPTQTIALEETSDNEAIVDPIGATGVRSMIVNMGGSGAIDNIRLSVPAEPDVSVIKSAGPASGAELQPGDALTYEIVVTNESQRLPANEVRVTDTVDDEYVITSVSPCDNGAGFSGQDIDCVIDVAAGGSTAVTVTGRIVEQDGLSDCTLTNTATAVFEDDTPQNNVSNTVSHTILQPFCDADDWAIQKAASPAGDSLLSPGDALDYTITVSHESGVAAAQGAVVTDTLDSEFVATGVDGCNNDDALLGQDLTCEVDVPVGGAAVITVSGTIADEVDDCSLANTATLQVEDADASNNTSNSVSHTIDPLACAPGLQFAKSADAAEGAVLEVGDSLTYSLVVTETTGNGWTAPITIADQIPAGLGIETVDGCPNEVRTGNAITCVIDGLDGGASHEVTVQTIVVSAPADCVLTNAASATSGEFDRTSRVTHRVPHEGCRQFTKTLVSINGGAVDGVENGMALVGAEPWTIVEPGDVLIYRFDAVSGDALEDASTVTITDEVDTDLEAPTLDDIDGCATVDVDGQLVTCVLDVQPGTTSSATLTAVVAAGDRPNRDCEFTNYAQARWGADVYNADSSAVFTVPPSACADDGELAFAKTATPADTSDLNVGDTLSYDLTVREVVGATWPYEIEISDDVPSSLEIVDVTGCPGYSPARDGGAVRCSIDGLAANASHTVRITTRIATAPSDCVVANTATARSDAGPSAFIEDSSVSHRVLHDGCWTFSKSVLSVDGHTATGVSDDGIVELDGVDVTSVVDLGTQVVYRFELSQQEAVGSSTYVIEDELDAEYAAPMPGDVSGCDELQLEGHRIRCSVTLHGQSAARVVLTARVAQFVNCEMPNEATISRNGTRGPRNGVAGIVLVDPAACMQVAPRVVIAKSATPGSGSIVTLGSEIVYTLRVSETNGGQYMNEVTVTDVISQYLTVTAVDNCPGYSLTRDGRNVRCTYDGMAANSTQTATITTTVSSLPPANNSCIVNSAEIDVEGSLPSSVEHRTGLACTGFHAGSLGFAMAFSMLAMGGVMLHATGGARRRGGFPLA